MPVWTAEGLPSSPPVGRGEPSEKGQDGFPITQVGNDRDGDRFPIKDVSNNEEERFPLPAFTLARRSGTARKREDKTLYINIGLQKTC